MKNFLARNFPYLIICVFVMLVLYASLIFIIFVKLSQFSVPTESRTSANADATSGVIIPSPVSVVCDEACKVDIVNRVIASLPTTAPTQIVKPTVAPSTVSPKTAYIPLDANYSTTSTNWIDVVPASVNINLTSDYGNNAKAYFEVFLHTENGSGEAHARLFDVTHGIVVNGSDLKTSLASSTLITSGVVSLWSGNNLYRVQISSLDSSKVFIDSARIKISY